MSDKPKTHYRKVFKSDHLGVADLEDLMESKVRMVFTIKHVRQEFNVAVAGRKGNYNIAYFVEDIKPLVLNAGNSKTLKGLADNSPFVEDWVNIPVGLYIDYNAKLKGEAVGGVRINPNAPAIEKPELTPEHRGWDNAVKSFKEKGNLKAVMEHMTISKENQTLIMEQSENV